MFSITIHNKSYGFSFFIISWLKINEKVLWFIYKNNDNYAKIILILKYFVKMK